MVKNTEYFTGRQEEFYRSDVRIAPYNPRKISASQKATLKRSLEKYGVVGGIVVNKRTRTIVGGNQKVTILDEMLEYPKNNYVLLAEAVDIDEKTEKEMNFMLNSDNARGDWDEIKARELLSDIDFQNAGLTEKDLSVFGLKFFSKNEEEEKLVKELNTLLEPIPETKEKSQQESRKEQQEVKKRIEQNQIIASQRQEEQYKAREQSGFGEKVKIAEKALDNESYVMLSFESISNKERFLRKFGFSEKDKVIKGELLIDIS